MKQIRQANERVCVCVRERERERERKRERETGRETGRVELEEHQSVAVYLN